MLLSLLDKHNTKPTGWKERGQVSELTGHSRCQLPGCAVGHVHNGGGSLVHHHLVLVPQAALDEVKQGAVVTIRKSQSIDTMRSDQVAPVRFFRDA